MSKFNILSEYCLSTPYNYINNKQYDFIDNIVLYRYQDVHFGITAIQLFTFRVFKETPCGFWYVRDNEEKWVSKKAKRRYCYPSKEDAWDSFKHRKRAHLRHLKNKLDGINQILKIIDKKELDGNLNF